MISALYALGRVNGAETFLLGFTGCALLYLAVCFLFPCNRKPKCRRRIFAGLIITGLFCDTVIFFGMFPGGEYVNHGIGSAYGVLLWPLLLLLVGSVLTAFHGE